MALSRRMFLLQSTCLAGLFWAGAAPVRAQARQHVTEDSVGFIGASTIQLTLVDTKLAAPESVEVTASDRVVWSPDPTKDFGSVGKLNGRSGNFSGNESATMPQLFTSWAKVEKGSRLGGFRLGKEDHQKHALADEADQWQVTVDGTAVQVTALYRKSTPVQTMAVANGRFESTKRHVVTFELDQDIPEGAVVAIKGPSVKRSEHRREKNPFSEAIHVCHAGYPLTGPKKAYVGAWWGQDQNGRAGNTDGAVSEDTVWRLTSTQDGAEAMSGRLRLVKPGAEPHRKDLNFNGCDIYEADFSDLNLEGDFHLHVDGLGRSFPFPVSLAPYDKALRLAARWYYYQRSGCEIAEPFGEGISRPRDGHPDDGLRIWQTDVKLGVTSEGYGKARVFELLSEYVQGTGGTDAAPELSTMSTNPSAWGGWHDAGDWDRRVQHMDVVFHMAELVEAHDHCRTLDLNLPESGKPFAHPAVKAKKNAQDIGDGQTVLPDLIHEALWGASLWRRTQHEDGAIIGGVEYSRSGIFGSVSWNPVQKIYAYGPEVWAAYRFVFGAAKLGHVIKNTCADQVLGDAIIAEALLAWNWAEQQPVPDMDEADETAVLSKSRVAEARVAAAAALYRATGNKQARAAYEAHNPFAPQADTPVDGVRLGVYPYSNTEYMKAAKEGRPVNSKVYSAIGRWIKSRALKGERMGRDFGLHTTATYPWGRGWMRFGPGSNWRAGQFAMYGALVEDVPQDLLDKAAEGMWFGLGCNPANVSFVQGMGHRDFSDPLMTDRRGTATIPGQISFGVAGGKMHKWEQRKTQGSIYPSLQDDWPIYNQIFESRSIAVTAEHDMKANAMEWLVACAFATRRPSDEASRNGDTTTE